MSDGPTCEQCRHWDAEHLRNMPSFGELRLQAPCSVASPARVAPWRWQWENACPKFAADMREYQVPNPGAVMTDIRVPRVFTEPALQDRIHPTIGRLISAVQIATAEEHK